MKVLSEAKEMLHERSKLSREATLADKILDKLDRELGNLPLQANRNRLHFKSILAAYNKKDRAFKKRMEDLAPFSVRDAHDDIVEVMEKLQAVSDTNWQKYFDSAQDLLELIIYAETHPDDE